MKHMHIHPHPSTTERREVCSFSEETDVLTPPHLAALERNSSVLTQVSLCLHTQSPQTEMPGGNLLGLFHRPGDPVRTRRLLALPLRRRTAVPPPLPLVLKSAAVEEGNRSLRLACRHLQFRPSQAVPRLPAAPRRPLKQRRLPRSQPQWRLHSPWPPPSCSHPPPKIRLLRSRTPRLGAAHRLLLCQAPSSNSFSQKAVTNPWASPPGWQLLKKRQETFPMKAHAKTSPRLQAWSPAWRGQFGRLPGLPKPQQTRIHGGLSCRDHAHRLHTKRGHV